MAASNSSNVPQGFSIYQPVLGAQLQFFPAVGTQELDQLLHAFIPGSASIQEKRASVALDFFEHLEVTGESFKFYPVYFMTTPVESPVTASPAQESGYVSCFNESPVMSNWDWSQISQATSQSSNSRRRQTSKASVSRHQTAADFSHLPGMKIMTKDGLDVTNSASRGSKTKEQRDHAHLMRIIKACDSCRKKKVRCDPSHKKRSVAQAQSQPAQKSAKKSKTKAAPQAQVANPAVVDNDFTSLAPFELDPSFALTDLSSVSPAEPTYESWEDFIQFPATNNTEDYDFLADPEGLFSSPESLTMSASSKPDTPVSTQYQPSAVGLPNPQPDLASSRLPYDQTESVHDYVDFNLYSPASSCSSLSASSPKPSIPEHRQENTGTDELFSSCDFSLLTPSSEQVQHATSFVGSGLFSIEGALAFSETPFDAAISRQNYYAGTDTTNLDDYSVEVDVNHNVDHIQPRVGDDHNADSGTADTGESWYNDSSSAVIATTAIATSAIATVATIANADVNANDLQPTLAEHATRDEQQDSSRLNRRHGYSELIIGGVRRSRIESIDEGGTIATAIATPAIEALPQESTPTAEIATPALETYQQESSLAEIAASTGTTLPSPTTYHAPSGTLQPYDASSVILATSHTGMETNIVSQHISSSLTDTATLRTTSLLLTSMLVSAYASGDKSVDSWKAAIMMATLSCAVLCICYNLMYPLGHRGQFYKGLFGRNEKQRAEKNDLKGLRHWQALRCQASAATRSVGQIMSRAGTSIAV